MNLSVVRPLVDKFYELNDVSISKLCGFCSSKTSYMAKPRCVIETPIRRSKLWQSIGVLSISHFALTLWILVDVGFLIFNVSQIVRNCESLI